MNKSQAAQQYPNACGAAILGNNPKFWRYIEAIEPGVQVRTARDVVDWMYSALDIASRKELDEKPEKRAQWFAVVADFNEYLKTGFQQIPKKTVWECPELRAIARLAPCMKCGHHQGEDRVVACHTQGFWATQYGKGVAQKPSDFMVAYLCDQCHRLMDSYDKQIESGASETGDEWEDRRMVYAMQWAALIFKTYEWLFTHGFLVPVNGHKREGAKP